MDSKNAALKGQIFVQDIGESLLPILSPERCTTVEHFIQQDT
jgi:hypothetical protein